MWTKIFERSALEASARSSGLGFLVWVFGLTMSGFCVALATAPTWALIGLGGLLVAELGLGGYAFIWCLHNNPNLLRSETYNIQKSLVDKYTVGDDINGLHEIALASLNATHGQAQLGGSTDRVSGETSTSEATK